MKTSVLLLLTILSLAACQKSGVGPHMVKTNPTDTNKDSGTVINLDTLANNAAFRLKLSKDDNNYDETLLMFKKAANLNYVSGEDAVYLQGFGKESLASISNDGKALSINSMPFTAGMTIGLDVQVKDDGAYSLQVSYENKITTNIQIWVKDTYLKDSVNVAIANYNFNVTKADTNSFGSKRFKLIVR